jgi:hypothetical protein
MIDHLIIIYSALVRYWRKNGNVMGQCINYVQILRRHMTQSEVG